MAELGALEGGSGAPEASASAAMVSAVMVFTFWFSSVSPGGGRGARARHSKRCCWQSAALSSARRGHSATGPRHGRHLRKLDTKQRTTGCSMQHGISLFRGEHPPCLTMSTSDLRCGSTAQPIRMAICCTILMPVWRACQLFFDWHTALRKGSSAGMPSAEATTAGRGTQGGVG